MILKPLIKQVAKPALKPALKALLATDGGAAPPTPSESYDFTTGTMPGNLTFTRASVASYLAADGTLAYASVDTPRFKRDHDTLEIVGLMMEPPLTNRAIFSEDFTDAAWTKTNVTVTPDVATAPDGTNTADRIVASAISGFHFVRRNTATTTATASVFLKADGLSAAWIAVARTNSESVRAEVILDLDTGAVTSSGAYFGATLHDFRIEKYAGGWWRVSVSGEAAGAVGMFFGPGSASTTVHTGDGALGVFAWGANFTDGSPFALNGGSYIPNPGGSQVTRAADLLSLTSVAGIDSTKGTFVAKVSSTFPPSNEAYFSAKGSASNEIYARRVSSSNPCVCFTTSEQANISPLGASFKNAHYKLAFAYALNSFGASINGGAVVTDTAGNVPPSISTVELCRRSSAQYLCGVLYLFEYYAVRVSDSDLMVISGS